MSTHNAGAFSSTDTEDSEETVENPAEKVDQLREVYETTETDPLTDLLFDVVTDMADAARQRGEQLEAATGRIDELEEQVQLIDPLRKKLSTTQDELSSVKDELQQYKERNEKDKAEIRGDVHETDEQAETNFSLFDTLNQKVKEFSGELKRVNDGRNSLEQIVRLPSQIAQEALSKNQLRARTIVSDLTSLKSIRAKGGQTLIDSSTIREKLQEMHSKAHHQTVNRVMDFIEEMGGEHVWTKKHREKNHRQLVIEDELLDLLATAEELDADEIDRVNTNGVMATVSKG